MKKNPTITLLAIIVAVAVILAIIYYKESVDCNQLLMECQRTKADLKKQVDKAQDQLIDLQTKKSRLEKEKSLCEALVKKLKSRINDPAVSVQSVETKLKLTILDKVLFDFAEITITEKGKRILDKIGKALKSVEKERISVEGHSDNVPLIPFNRYGFESNWEISTGRATAVVRYIQHRFRIDPKNIQAVGFSYYHPVDISDTSVGRSKNRRVEIIIKPVYEMIAPP